MKRPPTASVEKQAVLIIDDDPIVRSSLKFALEVEGFAVRAYSGPYEFLNETDLPAKSCLLIDYYMPGMDGLVRNANWGRTDHPLRDGSSLASTRGRLRGQRYILAQSSGDRTAAHAAATANPTHHEG